MVSALFLSQMISAQGTVKWTGAVNNDWTNAGNWMTVSGVPSLPPMGDNDGDQVIISGTAPIMPVVLAGDAAFAKMLVIEANASLTVQATASLLVENSETNGLENSGIFHNYGTVDIDSSYLHAMVNNAGAQIINHIGGVFSLMGGTDICGINNAGGTITNDGDFYMEYGDVSVLYNFGMITNNAGANFYARFFRDGKGIYNGLNASIINAGKLETNNGGFNPTPYADTLIVNLGSIQNADGAIFRGFSYPGNGFFNGQAATLTNEGSIRLESLGGNFFFLDNFGIIESDSLTAQAGGNAVAIYNHTGASFTNKSYLAARYNSSNQYTFVNEALLKNNPGAYMDIGTSSVFDLAELYNTSTGIVQNMGTIDLMYSSGSALLNMGIVENTGNYTFIYKAGGNSTGTNCRIENYGTFTAESSGLVDPSMGYSQQHICNYTNAFMYLHSDFVGVGQPNLMQNSGGFIKNDGYLELYTPSGRVNFRSFGSTAFNQNPDRPIILNTINGTFKTNDTLGFQNTHFPIINEGKFYLEMGSFVDVTNSGSVLKNTSTGQFFNYADFVVTMSSGGLVNQGTFTTYEGTNFNYTKMTQGINGIVDNTSTGVFHNYGRFYFREHGFNSVANEGRFINYEPANIDIGNSNGHGVYNLRTGQFTNKGFIVVNGSGADSINGSGVLNEGQFVNQGIIEVGQLSQAVGQEAVVNRAGTFLNDICGVINVKEDNLVLDESNSFTNKGVIIENGTGNSNIASNLAEGVVVNLAGGIFSIGANAGQTGTDLSIISCASCLAGGYLGIAACLIPAIPTLSQWSIIILFLSLSILGWVTFRTTGAKSTLGSK